MTPCKQCGGEISNKLLKDYCLACLEKAMDNLAEDDIAEVMNDLVKQGGDDDDAKSTRPLSGEGSRDQ